MKYKRSTKYGNNKIEINGVKFDSELESYCYKMLNILNIKFEFQKQIILIDKFKYNKESIRAITAIVDFVLDHNGNEIYIDTKGFATEVSKIKYKMLKHQLKDKQNTEVVWLHSKKEVTAYLNNLITKQNGIIKQSNIDW
jgi:hypothetical protein